MSANERQVGGAHYTGDIQHWDLVWHYGLSYLPGCITKYACRYARKNGREDLEKALHFAEKYAESLAHPVNTLWSRDAGTLLKMYCEYQRRTPDPYGRLQTLSFMVLQALCAPHGPDTVQYVIKYLQQMLAEWDRVRGV